MDIRIFYTFLILLTTGILFFVPITDGIYAFRTDTKIDERPSSTAVGETTENITLTAQVYQDDTTTLTLLSDYGSDIPVLSSYESSSHSIVVSGLTANETRMLTITYDIAALTLWSGIDTLLGWVPMIWYACLIAFIPLSLFVVWKYMK